VLIDKHFFHYKYDYRDEWLRIIRTLSSQDEVGDTRFHAQAIRALAQIIDSPGGVLFMKRDNGRFEPEEFWNIPVIQCAESENSTFVRFLEEQQFVIRFDELARQPEVYTRLAPLFTPDWVSSIKNAWLAIPLILHDSLSGFVILTRSPSHQRYYNWEDSDLLKTAGRQVASHLGQYESAQALASARRFDEMNRLSAFVMHDLKNMISQLSFVVSNAGRHKNNPNFIDDAISTIENSVDKMNRLMARLQGTSQDNVKSVDLCLLAEEVVRNCNKSTMLPMPILVCQAEQLNVTVDRDRMIANLGHIIQNAQDATSDHGNITIRLKKKDSNAVIEVQDTGCGMDSNFIKNKLFQPFESTKGTMGIGVFQVREFVYKLGGDLEVESEVGKGTVFRIIIPLNKYSDNIIQYPTMVNKS
jgi:putative PEP-CTERM system histidine kinase